MIWRVVDSSRLFPVFVKLERNKATVIHRSGQLWYIHTYENNDRTELILSRTNFRAWTRENDAPDLAEHADIFLR